MGYTLVLGGARSGKSDLAARLALDSGLPVTFIATATAGDGEMAERIERHRAARPTDWNTVEAPLELASAVAAVPPGQFVVLDCLTLWVSNLLEAGTRVEDCFRRAEDLSCAFTELRGVVVSNEVGLGIVPATELGRAYRDVLGAVNTRFAEHAERALLLVAGRTVELGRL